MCIYIHMYTASSNANRMNVIVITAATKGERDVIALGKGTRGLSMLSIASFHHPREMG